MRELKFKEVKVRRWNFRSSEDKATAYKANSNVEFTEKTSREE